MHRNRIEIYSKSVDNLYDGFDNFEPEHVYPNTWSSSSSFMKSINFSQTRRNRYTSNEINTVPQNSPFFNGGSPPLSNNGHRKLFSSSVYKHKYTDTDSNKSFSNSSLSSEEEKLCNTPTILSHQYSKGAGIIPYTYDGDKIKFLFQRYTHPNNTKNLGWNDFGGKKEGGDFDSIETAVREFSEETTCMFFLNDYNRDAYNMIRDYNEEKSTSEEKRKMMNIINGFINLTRTEYEKKMRCIENIPCLYSRDTYTCYFMPVKYINSADFPSGEDLHVYYDDRYQREFKWMTCDELSSLGDRDFHKRLQVLKIKDKIRGLCETENFFDIYINNR